MTANDCYRPPIDAQLRYTVQWFHEWSEMQRGDFLPILAQKLAPGSYVNGLMSGIDNLSCNEGRPPSLFQCRVKLFREWFETWTQAERDQLLGHIKSMDPGFHNKIQDELDALSGKATNGFTVHFVDDYTINAVDERRSEVPPASEERHQPAVEDSTEQEVEAEEEVEVESVEESDAPADATLAVNGEEDDLASS